MDQLMFLISLKFDNLSDVNMLEFGDQVFIGAFPERYEHFATHNFTTIVPSSGAVLTPAKVYFEHVGMKRTSVDFNGNNGALKLDARMQLRDLIPGPKGQFNLITNLGFSEHIGEQDIEKNLLHNQYAIFKNFHDVGEVGSVYFHHVPRMGQWNRHGVCDDD
jgi:hypothetical protein